MSLAIVIPAFKGKYFKETLQSIEDQTCKDFQLYIGDDDSPDNLRDIVCSTLKTVQYTYKKFDKNLGSQNLVAQWERCIDLINDERWIWLFGDDDVMSSKTIEFIIPALNTEKSLIRLNKASNIERLQKNNFGTEKLNFKDFLRAFSINETSMSDFLYKRSVYCKVGITNFPAAWNSDIATILNISLHSNGIFYFNSKLIYFRKSDLHISNPSNNKPEKIKADRLFLIWLVSFLRKLNKNEKDVFFEEFNTLLFRKLHIIFKAQNTVFFFIKNLIINFKLFGLCKGVKNLFYLLR
ncbi:glycosyltransferase family 2 protein [Marivirga salinae]|uniref:Glycosyltransferase family 2 protein n=1 Tax=Marivirga salinarum TaxID=3059078 RepID=A0AA51NC01_9BACT|nr:glycosyltransferase family 2 protein [Marivirga sp. BDSF4-3]WMN12189.1 glycosyltransferase family 2 protein [Marivirga sp. BDSF4-3]